MIPTLKVMFAKTINSSIVRIVMKKTEHDSDQNKIRYLIVEERLLWKNETAKVILESIFYLFT